MPSFFEKLNMLVQSHINDIIHPLTDEADEGTRRQVLSRRDIRLGLDGDLRILKKRVDDALAHEAKLQARVDKLYAEIAQWDAKADDYLRQNSEAQARYALTQLRRAQADLEIAEQTLREHHIVTQELVTKVTQLEAILEDARQREEAEPPARTEVRSASSAERLAKPEDRLSAPPKPAQTSAPKRIIVQVERNEEDDRSTSAPVNVNPRPVATPAESTPSASASESAPTEQKPRYGEAEVAKGEALARKIAQKLDETREKLGSLVSSYEQMVAEDKPDVLEEVKREVQAAEVDDDLARRRARLAKPE